MAPPDRENGAPSPFGAPPRHEGHPPHLRPVGIVSYGFYVPRYRIRTETIAQVWGHDGPQTAANLNVRQKSVPGPDEDVATISVEATRQAIDRVGFDPRRVGAIYVGSESHPYAVKPTGTILAAAIGAGPELTAADFEFACKAGTAAMQTAMGLVRSSMVDTALVVAADTSQGAPRNALEYSASAGGAAFLIGSEDIIASLNHTVSFTTDTPDFWRREGQKYPSHGERFTGRPAFFRHVKACAERMMAAMESTPDDYQHAVFHQPNGKFPVNIAKQLGFTMDQIQTGLLAPKIGNTYSAAAPLGLAAVLDIAAPGDRVFVTGYGSGAGSDAFDITVTDAIVDYRKKKSRTVEEHLAKTVDLDYSTYAKYRGKIILGD
ncbi:MAG: hydroxymethylglutaryl-CoA synthase [Euryarchaeota archaeon]|nr:hydroxymethylglutaryl-CoA synthase [Euryarchaeota archaeon]